MPLTVNGYNSTFSAFVDFANAHKTGGGKAVARFEEETLKLGKARKIVPADSNLDGVGKSRDKDQQNLNDSVRTSFRNAIRDMFGGESKIPENVKKAMILKDYDEGKPLTARRILAVKEAIDKHISGIPDKLEIEVCGKKLTFDKNYYERMVEIMPEAERPHGLSGRTELANILKATLTTRIQNGLQILQDVRAGNGGQHQASAANVADLTLALQAIALSNGDRFNNGAISVADRDGRLAKWLDTSSELYLRRSSHLKAYQNMTVDGHLNVMRGIDVAEGIHGLFSGMKTVHYGTIPDLNSPTGDGCGPNRRLFLKCESHGVYNNPLFRTSTNAGMTPGMTIRAERKGDRIESLKHAFSFAHTRGADPTANGARKEHMTAGVKIALNYVYDELKAAGRNDLVRLFESKKTEKGGAMMLLDNLNKAHLNEPDNQLLARLVNDVFLATSADFEGKHGDVNSRLGNEVMIEDNDIASFLPGQN